MKRTSFSSFVILGLLLLFASCAAKQPSSNATLEVSRSFAVTSAGFDGGLVIVGKNTTTSETFSVSLATGLSSTLTLSKGNWTFLTVGWDGTKAFTGIPYCGITTADLIEDAQTVSISADKATCQLPAFSAGHWDTAAGTIKKLSTFITCNSFFKTAKVLNADNISSKLITSSDADSFCEAYPANLKGEVKGIKIFAVNKTLAGVEAVAGLSSECISGPANSTIIHTANDSDYISDSLRLPLSSIPFAVATYRDSNCSDLSASYPFKNGLSISHPDLFDHLLQPKTDNVSVRLLVPGNDFKRAVSPFMAIVPSIRCYNDSLTQEVPCPIMPLATTADYHAYVGRLKQILLKGVACPTTLSASTNLGTVSCSNPAEGAMLSFTPVNPSSSTPENIDLDGTVYTVFVSDQSTPMSHKKWDVISKLMDVFGISNPNNPKNFFIYDNDRIDDHGPDDGKLGMAFEILSGAGGSVPLSNLNQTFADACANLIGSNTMTMPNRNSGVLETFTVSITNLGVGQSDFPRITCASTGVLNPTSCDLFPTKRITISKSDAAFMTLDFRCDQQVGKLRLNESDSYESSQEFLTWNTEVLIKQRFEYLRSEIEYSNTQPVGYDRSMVRLTKNSNQNIANIWSYDFHSYKKTTDWEENLQSDQYIVNYDGSNATTVEFDTQSHYDPYSATGLKSFDDATFVNDYPLMSTSAPFSLSLTDTFSATAVASACTYPYDRTQAECTAAYTWNIVQDPVNGWCTDGISQDQNECETLNASIWHFNILEEFCSNPNRYSQSECTTAGSWTNHSAQTFLASVLDFYVTEAGTCSAGAAFTTAATCASASGSWTSTGTIPAIPASLNSTNFMSALGL